MSEDADLIRLIKSGLAGDVFFHYMEQDDPSMERFREGTGYPFHTILLAANARLNRIPFTNGAGAEPLYLPRRPGGLENYSLDSSKPGAALSRGPTYSLDDGLRETLRFWNQL